MTVPTGVVASMLDNTLRTSGFRTSSIPLASGEPVLVAEDEFSLAAVVAADSVNTLQRLIPELEAGLANWAAERNAHEKQWDLYVLALSTDSAASDDELATAERMSRDLRYVRKIIRTGVEATIESVRSALLPLLPIETPDIELIEPLQRLEERLPEFGVPADVAGDAIAAFQSTGRLEWTES